MSDNIKGVQDKYGPNGTCFGCGPKNEKGLQIKSNWEGDDLILRFTPEDHHQAFPGVINGGIIGTLFDCHQNWAAATKFYKQESIDDFPSTVTSKFEVSLKRPTPYGVELVIKAQVVKIEGNLIFTKAQMYANDKVTATSEAVFARVKEGHPAYHRWN